MKYLIPPSEGKALNNTLDCVFKDTEFPLFDSVEKVLDLLKTKKSDSDIQSIYGTSLEKAKKIMYDIAVASENVCTDPDPRVRFRTFGDSGLRLQLLAWIEKPELRGKVIDELSTLIYNSFNEEKIEIPFPQRTVHIKKTDI